jgi:hypothetical protein
VHTDGSASLCSGVRLWRALPLNNTVQMISFFMDGPDVVRWELTQADPSGACRLAIHHARGVSVEFFRTAAMALLRVQELENLLAAARGMSLAQTGLAS